MRPLRLGIAGFGYTGQLHLTACVSLDGIEVVAVADPRLDSAAVPAGVGAFQDYRDLLTLGLDAIHICLPTALHAESAILALRAGCHVLVEKPIATSMADAERMMAAANVSQRFLYTGMTHRFYPEIQQAKALVDRGDIGELVMVRDSILEYAGLLGGPSWYRSRAMAGGGTVLSSGVHLIDRVLWFLDETPFSVSGFVSSRMLGGEVEDTAQMSLQFEGCSAQITFGWLAHPHPLICDLELIGTRGSIVVHTWQGLECRGPEGVRNIPVYTSESHQEKVVVGLRGEILEFCDAIRGGRTPWPSVKETSRAVRIVEAFYESARTGATVDLKGAL